MADELKQERNKAEVERSQERSEKAEKPSKKKVPRLTPLEKLVADHLFVPTSVAQKIAQALNAVGLETVSDVKNNPNPAHVLNTWIHDTLRKVALNIHGRAQSGDTVTPGSESSLHGINIASVIEDAPEDWLRQVESRLTAYGINTGRDMAQRGSFMHILTALKDVAGADGSNIVESLE